MLCRRLTSHRLGEIGESLSIIARSHRSSLHFRVGNVVRLQDSRNVGHALNHVFRVARIQAINCLDGLVIDDLAGSLLGLSTTGSQAQGQQRNEGSRQKTLFHEGYSFEYL